MNINKYTFTAGLFSKRAQDKMHTAFRFFAVCLIFLFPLEIMSQSDAVALTPIQKYHQQRLRLNAQAMTVLGGWALANIGSGLILGSRSTGTRRYFHQMNAGWNGINLAIAGFGYVQSIKKLKNPAVTLGTTLTGYQDMQGAFLFNAGLDAAYIAGGLWLIERSKNTTGNPDRLKGFGQSVIMQGAFLMLFDIINYGLHAAQFKHKLYPILNDSGIGIGTSW